MKTHERVQAEIPRKTDGSDLYLYVPATLAPGN